MLTAISSYKICQTLLKGPVFNELFSVQLMSSNRAVSSPNVAKNSNLMLEMLLKLANFEANANGFRANPQ